MRVGGLTPILNVSDIPDSLAWFEGLGWRTHWIYPRGSADPGFASVICGTDVEIFLCRGAQGSRGGPAPKHAGDDDSGGVWMSWWLPSPPDVDAAHELALADGCEVSRPPADEPWGVREFHLRHPDGHTFRVSAPLESDEES